MATLTLAIQVSLQSGQRGAIRSAPGHIWRVRWEEDGDYTLFHFPTQPAAYEMKCWRFEHQGTLVEFARTQGWPIDHDHGWIPLE